MIRMFRNLFALITTVGLVSCGIVSRQVSSVENLPEQSAFRQTYSIGSIVENHTDLLLEGQRTLSGREAGPRVPFVQNQEIMFVLADQNNATMLMEAIRSDIEETLHNSGATITGSGGFDGEANPVAYFSYSYQEGPFYGVLDIWGIRSEGTQFILNSQVTESLDSRGN